MLIARRIPYIRINAIEDAREHVSAGAEQTVETHAAGRCPDLRGVGGRYRGDPVGELQPSLQESDAAIVFDTLDGERIRWKAEMPQQPRRKLPWNARLWIVITVGASMAPA